MWHEDLPEQCPPSDAIEPNELVCYRLCEKMPFAESDFLSHRELSPDKIFNTPECIARAVSVFTGLEDCKDLQKLAVHKTKVVAKITLSPATGLIKKTGKAKTHYSWWRSKGFDPLLTAEAVEVVQ